MAGEWICVDGNEAAAWVAYARRPTRSIWRCPRSWRTCSGNWPGGRAAVLAGRATTAGPSGFFDGQRPWPGLPSPRQRRHSDVRGTATGALSESSRLPPEPAGDSMQPRGPTEEKSQPADPSRFYVKSQPHQARVRWVEVTVGGAEPEVRGLDAVQQAARPGQGGAPCGRLHRARHCRCPLARSFGTGTRVTLAVRAGRLRYATRVRSSCSRCDCSDSQG